jgi:TolB-like protein/Tfp pilus assembly protein PilF
VQLRLLGGLELGAPPARLPTRKTGLLLAALALAGPRGMRREALCALLWPDRADPQARNSLRQALAALRQALVPPLSIEADLDSVHLAGPAEAVDAWAFETRHDPGLYRGDLLAGEALDEAANAFFLPHRQALRRRALALAEQLSTNPADAAAEAACASLAERLLVADPAAEEAHRALIRLELRHGHLNAARRRLALCQEALLRELGAEPEPETLALLAEPAGPRPPAPAPAHERPSVVVMPFDNLSGAADDYFVDGVVEEITAALSRVRDFFVIARQTAFTYKGRLVDVRAVGAELGVNYVVEGTLRRAGERLRISVQLVDAASRAQLWSDRYEGETTDIFDFQDRIAAQVAAAIHPAVRHAEIEAARRRPPGSLRAHDLVLQAHPRIWAQSAAENAQAIALLRQAIEADPRHGRAHALLAWCHSQAVVYLWTADPAADRRAAALAAETAVGIIADDPTALAAAGAAISQCLDDLARAGTLIEAALALDPNNAWAWQRHGWLAIFQNDAEAAMARFRRALALNPLDPLAFNLRFGMALAHSIRGDDAEAVRMVREVLHTHPNVTWAQRQLAFMLVRLGDLDGAREAIAKLRAARPGISIALMRQCHPMRHLGARFEAMVDAWREAGLPER